MKKPIQTLFYVALAGVVGTVLYFGARKAVESVEKLKAHQAKPAITGKVDFGRNTLTFNIQSDGKTCSESTEVTNALGQTVVKFKRNSDEYSFQEDKRLMPAGNGPGASRDVTTHHKRGSRVMAVNGVNYDVTDELLGREQRHDARCQSASRNDEALLKRQYEEALQR